LADALFGASELQPKTLRRWKQIEREMRRLLPFRNDLAHNPPVQMAYITVVGDQVSRHEQEWKVRTDPTKLLHKPSRKFEAAADDIAGHVEKVEYLERAIAALRWELMGRPLGLSSTPEFPAEMDQW
jgi:hypothetical protein